MKNLFALIALVFVFAVNAQDKKPQYHKFVEGTFLLINPGEKIDSLIIRRENGFQKEYGLIDGKEKQFNHLKVIWVSKSVYILRSVKQINNSDSFLKGDVKCKIIETGDGYYKVRAWLKGGKKSEFILYTYQAD